MRRGTYDTAALPVLVVRVRVVARPARCGAKPVHVVYPRRPPRTKSRQLASARESRLAFIDRPIVNGASRLASCGDANKRSPGASRGARYLERALLRLLAMCDRRLEAAAPETRRPARSSYPGARGCSRRIGGPFVGVVLVSGVHGASAPRRWTMIGAKSIATAAFDHLNIHRCAPSGRRDPRGRFSNAPAASGRSRLADALASNAIESLQVVLGGTSEAPGRASARAAGEMLTRPSSERERARVTPRVDSRSRARAGRRGRLFRRGRRARGAGLLRRRTPDAEVRRGKT